MYKKLRSSEVHLTFAIFFNPCLILKQVLEQNVDEEVRSAEAAFIRAVVEQRKALAKAAAQANAEKVLCRGV